MTIGISGFRQDLETCVGIAQLSTLDGSPDGHPVLAAARADFLRWAAARRDEDHNATLYTIYRSGDVRTTNEVGADQAW
jgi:hypothetical protein